MGQNERETDLGPRRRSLFHYLRKSRLLSRSIVSLQSIGVICPTVDDFSRRNQVSLLLCLCVPILFLLLRAPFLLSLLLHIFVLGLLVPVGSPSRGGDVVIYFFDVKQLSLPCPFFFFKFCSCVCFCFYGPFNCISLHKFSRQLSVFSPCSTGLNDALLVLSIIHLFIKVSLSPDLFLCD